VSENIVVCFVSILSFFFFFQAEDGIRDGHVTGVQTCALPIFAMRTFTPDDIDWEDEVRIAMEERAAFSPDALTGMEASLRFGGRSEERRVGKECRSRWSVEQSKKKEVY